MEYATLSKYCFGFFALIFVTAGAHHLYEYFVPELRPEYPPLRHLVFIVLNLILSFLMLKRTKYFVPVLFVISIHQLYGHGGSLLSGWLNGRSALYPDIVIVLLVPIIFSAYTYDVFREN